MIDVTHDRDDWRAHNEIFIRDIFEFLIKVNIKLFKKFAIFIFWAHNLDFESEFISKNCEGIFID